MKTIKKIEPKVPLMKKRKKVAAYARVSMQTERLARSLSAQVSHYSAMIQKNPDWEYAGVYADDFVSGTGTVKRDEFNRMLDDCEEGKIQLILTKSISRFARNTVDLLETVRHLKDIGVEVWFEKESIHSLDGNGELMLSILASFAQEESESISNNVKWGVRKRFEKGIPNGHFRIYGYRWEGDEMVIVPEEAKIVRRIFQNFLDGKSRLETERQFADEGITTRDGCKWVDSNIKKILTNITYTGNLLLQKEFISDPINKHRKQNRGELPQYYVEDHHVPIIDKETFGYVQSEIERRKELGALANKSLNTCCFTSKIKCPYCNQSYMHNKRTKNGNFQEYWNCGSKKKKKVGDGCPVGGTISHKSLLKASAEVLGLDEFDENTFSERIDHIEVPKKYTLEFFFKDGTRMTKDVPNTGHQDCWTAEYRARTSKKRRKKPNCKGSSILTGKIKCVYCGCNFRGQMNGTDKGKPDRKRYWRCAEHDGCNTVGLREDILKLMITEVIGTDEFDDAVFEKAIERIDVESADKIVFHLADGGMAERTWVKPKRVGKPRTEAQKEHMRLVMKGKWTPENRSKMSEKMRQLRKERGANWRKM